MTSRAPGGGGAVQCSVASAGSRRALPQDDRGEGHPDLAEGLGRDEEAGQQEEGAEELAQLVPLRGAEAVEAVGEGRDEGAQRDEQRGWHAAVDPAAQQGPDGAGQRGHEVDGDGDRCDEQVEEELVTRLTRVERVGQHATLGHEDVGREERAEDEREGSRDVQEGRQEAQLRRQDGGRGHAGLGSSE